MVPDWIVNVYWEQMGRVSDAIPVRSKSPPLRSPTVWARVELPNLLPGPWLGADERWAKTMGLTVGTPASGDLIIPPDSNVVERLA
jgi:hypothetical protein